MIGRTLSHYEITAKLGAGGMGEVYRAVDTKLGRDVALKVLPAEMASSPERLERFQREAKALAALDHPGIVTVFSVEEADGVHFLTMQLVEGQSIDSLIPEGGLPAERILEIGARIAGALAAAHDKGIVHRDLKPANVMVTAEGRVKVLDFGLARMSGVEKGPSGSHLATELMTREGVVMGTVPYMSPEQVSGLPVDHRSDIFSLGVILYEMAIGRRPFEGPSSAELASAILRDTPPPLGELRAGLPDRLAQVIGRCLEKNAADRWSSTLEVRNELRGAGAEETSAGAAPVRAPRPEVAGDSGAVRADEGFWVAVLPFKHSGADGTLEALAEGLSEEIVTGLSRFSYLRVIARSSTERYAGRAADIRKVGEEIGARYVMEGRLRQAGTTLRLAVQLVDATTGAHLWTETYERTFSAETAFELQDELVPRIVSTVADWYGALPHSMSAAVRRKPADQLSSYEAVLRSFGYFERISPEEHAAMRAALERAVEQAPGNADGWAMLSMMYGEEHRFGFNLLPDPLGRSLQAARRAVDIAHANHFAWLALAQALFFRREFDAFADAAERVIALNPMDGSTLEYVGHLMAFSGAWESGCEVAGRARQLNPNHPGWYWVVHFLDHYRQGDYLEARPYILKTVLRGGGAPVFTQALLVAVHGQLGEREQAEQAVHNILSQEPGFAQRVREEFAKWYLPELVERLIEGLRKAGLDVPETATGRQDATASAGSAVEVDTGSQPSEQRDATVAIAVLPFSDMSPAKDQEYFCDGMAEEVMNALVGIAGIRVAARTSAFRASREGNDLAAIGDLLGVSQVLEGSVRSAGGRLRVTAQLNDVESGFQLWSERYDRPTEDVFAIQDEIASGVVRAVEARLDPANRAVRSRPQTRNLEAYRWYLKARYLRGKEDHEEARRAFEEAIRLDPSYAPSWTGLADVLVVSTHFGLIPPLEGCAAARQALATAAELEGESVEALHAEAFVAYLERRWQDMEATWHRALELQPTHVLSLGALGTSLCTRQRFDEGMHYLERAREADPLSSFPYVRIAVGLLCWGRPEEALGYLENALIFEKEDLTALWLSCMAKVALGRLEEAIAEANQAVELSRRGIVFLGTLGWVLASAGRTDEARAILDELCERRADSPADVSEAWLLGGLEELDEAFEVLKRAEDEYHPLLYYRGLPPFDALRTDPRFAELLTKLELPAAASDEALAELDLERSFAVPAPVVSPSVAALPFLTLGDDADAEVFAEGMTEDVIAQLAKIGGLKVIARGSVMGFKERQQSLREIGERLGVSTLLDGSVRRAGDRVRIVVQLIEAASERPLWSETYDRRLDDIFAVQSDVALRVASALSAELSPDVQQRIEKRPTDNVEAYRLYVEGRHCLLRTTGEGIGKGLEFFGKAIRLDPGYAPPHAGMTLAYVWIGLGYAPGLLNSREANARAEDAARSALRLDPDLGFAHSMFGYVRMVAHYDWEVAEREMQKALELSPGVPESLGALGLLLSAQGRHEEAIDVTRRALELDPLTSVLSSDLATKYLRAGRFEDAIEQARRLLALEPEFPMAHSTLGWAYLKTDRTHEGIRELARAVEAAPGNTMLLAQLGQANAEAGRTEDARAILDQLSAMAAEQYVSPYHLAYVHTGLGEHDRAVEYLDRAYSESASGLYGVNGSFLFEPLHDHPGFRSLLRRMHLA